MLKSNGYYFSEVQMNSKINEKQNSIKLIYDIKIYSNYMY